MRTKHNFSFVLTTIVAMATLCSGAWAGSAKPRPCSTGLQGTWSGWADHAWPNGNLTWTAVHTVDSVDGTSGGMLLNWVPISGDLSKTGPGFRLTPGHGVWQLSGTGYKYTWYAYYVDDTTNSTLASVRVYGTVTKTDCDHLDITYTFEMYDGMLSPNEMLTATPTGSETGVAGETRAPLVVPAT